MSNMLKLCPKNCRILGLHESELTGIILEQLPFSFVPDKIKCVMLSNKN